MQKLYYEQSKKCPFFLVDNLHWGGGRGWGWAVGDQHEELQGCMYLAVRGIGFTEFRKHL